MNCLRHATPLFLKRRARILTGLATAALVFIPLQAAEPEENSPPDFNRDIRPILADNCYACHGPDQNQRMAGLRLDQQDSALGRLDSGNLAIVPGNPEESELIRRITAEDDARKMPPAYSGKELTRRQIDLLTRWIRQGAPWSKHWAYITPERPVLPAVKDRNWPANAIDHFILARLEREGISPSAEADRRTLIRRLTFDLTGLPPTVREVEDFLSDRSPKAYEKLVDRLLDSPHFGERMAMHWLDLARYADSDGYHIDFPRSMWKYRDWVIAAFNANKPFDRFTIEQLAGDLLPDPTLDQKIATAFNRNGMTSTEGGADAKEYLSKYVIDRVNTTTTVWLGSTVACAECHDHKFDPFTQQEYYRLYDFFHQIPEKGLDRDPAPPYLWLPSEEQRSRLSQLERTIRTLEADRQARLDMTHDGLDEAQAEWEGELARIHRTRRKLDLKEWSMIGPFIAPSAEEAFSRSFPPESELDFSKSYQDGKLSWNARPEWKDGKAQSLLGTKAATYLHRRIVAQSARKLKFFVATNAPYADGLKVWLNGQLILAKAVEGCEPAKSIEVQVDLRSGANDLLLKAVNYGGGYGFYFSLDAPLEDKALMQVMSAAAKPVLERDGAEKTALRHYFRQKNSSRLQTLAEQLSRLRKEKEQLEQDIPTLRVMEDMEYRRPSHILIRGDYRSKGERVSAGVPEFLPSLPPGGQVDRLALARWLVAPDHPLVGRVAVNRFWQLFFGAGIVRTANEFGTQGEPPSHPGLLDWLAREFVDGGWDVQSMLKTIAMSATYRQSSRFRPDLLSRDPANRLLARGPRLRLPAEAIRDNVLAISGLLDRNRPPGGPSVFPYQPPGLWENKAFYCRTKYEQSRGEDLYRRSLYTFWKRSVPNPILQTFDAPDREVCTVSRERTVTPLQALITLNETTYVEAARVFAQRILKEAGPSVRERVRFAYRTALARPPEPEEERITERTFHRIFETYRGEAATARQLASIGESPADADLDVTQLAAWTGVAKLILNLDETMTKE